MGLRMSSRLGPVLRRRDMVLGRAANHGRHMSDDTAYHREEDHDRKWLRELELERERQQERERSHRRAHPQMTNSMVSGRAKPVQFVQAHAGKGAVFNYSSRHRRPEADKKTLQDPEILARRNRAPGKPNLPFPEQHTFSLPSSSFNASSWVSSGVAPPLAGRSAAGIGEGWVGRKIQHKPTALIMPGQGSQYVTMARDLYESFATARRVWEEAEECITAFIMARPLDNMHPDPLRTAFEAHLARDQALEESVRSAPRSLKPGWLCDLVFRGSQLELTRSENAMPAILTVTLSFLAVLRQEFEIDFVKDHMSWIAGHGSGIYAALVATGAIEPMDALRAMRYRGLAAMNCLMTHPVLFPDGCEPPASMYETWAFANVSSGKGSNLVLDEEEAQSPDDTKYTDWRGTQVSAIVVRPGQLERALNEVQSVQAEIHAGRVPGIARDEFVETSHVNSQLQIVLAGTTVGVNYACDRLRFKGIGAHAVNLPMSGPYNTSFVETGSRAFAGLVDVMPLHEPCRDVKVVSSVDGRIFDNVEDIRDDLRVALSTPVRWLNSIDTLVKEGARRFVCLGPSRAIAQQLSRELALRERAQGRDGLAGNCADDPESLAFEVWSVATAEGVEQLVSSLRSLRSA